MAKPIILITGAHGQLGTEFRVLANTYTHYEFIFTDKEELSIDDPAAVNTFFLEHRPAFCINCAAYTAVDKAETEKDIAFKINADAVGILAAACKEQATRFVHISTDYVFDGTSPEPYKETDDTDPINIYGASKLRGEQLCLENNPDAIIIRTAWVYSPFGNNFVKTMIRLMREREEINVVNDQIGAPTYAADLAKCILLIIENWKPGIYHYSNTGKISWYNFAVAIRDLISSECVVMPVSSAQYPTAAQRPSFSLLDTTKIQHTFGFAIPSWKTSLADCIQRLLN